MYTSYRIRRPPQGPAGVAMILALGLLLVLGIVLGLALVFAPGARRAARPDLNRPALASVAAPGAPGSPAVALRPCMG